MAVQRIFLIVLSLVVMMALATELTTAQNMTFSCDSNWCGEKWKSVDRILLYNYSTEYDNITVVMNETRVDFEDNCTPIQKLLGTCKKVNITEEKTTVFSVPRYVRDPQPTIKTIPQELRLQLIATENNAMDVYNSTSDNYEPLTDKIWQIWIPRGCRMVLFFYEFDLESSTNCTKDYFSIQTSKKGEVTKFCGSVGEITNKTINIKNRRRVQFQFHSDDTYTRRGIEAAYCFQDQKTYDPDVPCNCNADTSGVKRRQTRKARTHGKHGEKTHHEHTKTKKGPKKESTKTNSKPKRVDQFTLQAMQSDQDQRIAQIVKNMMQDGLRAINHYKYSNDHLERVLADNYQRAMHSQAI